MRLMNQSCKRSAGVLEYWVCHHSTTPPLQYSVHWQSQITRESNADQSLLTWAPATESAFQTGSRKWSSGVAETRCGPPCYHPSKCAQLAQFPRANTKRAYAICHLSFAMFGRGAHPWLVATIIACGGGFSSGLCPARAAEPSTYLYDLSPAAVATLSGEGLSKQNSWSPLAEDDKAHRFAGCPVMMNDKIVAVFHQDAPLVDLYSRHAQAMMLCARLQPICDGSADLKPTSITVKENDRSLITLEVGLRSPSGAARLLTCELTAGAPFIQTVAGAGID